jgi:prepilin-type N-terminal cleavage/methylation domain-containing protein
VSRTSKPSWVARRLARRDDRGFTLVEVMASMVVFGLVSTAITAMFASGLRASLLTKMDTTGKNLSQQRFEAIKNLPFHIDQVASGTNPPDLLDTYYVSTSGGSVGRGLQGFVANGATRYTADGDPATGAFYRYVQNPIPGFPKFKQYVATQFIDDVGAPYSPSSFNALVYGSDTPPTALVGVGVTTIWTAGKLTRVARNYTQIATGRPAAATALLQAQMVALRLTGGLTGGLTLTMDLATFNADGAVSQTVTAASALRAATMSLSTDQSVNGALSSAQAPPNSGTLNDSSGPKSFIANGITYGGVGSSSTANVSAATSTGQPVIASSGSPARADVLGAGAGTRAATFAIDTAAPARLGLGTVHAFVDDAGCGGGCSNVGVTGYANSAYSGTTHTVTTASTASVKGVLALLPTTFAPSGLIRVNLTSASLSCTVTRTGSGTPTGSVAISYAGTLAYYAPFAAGAVNGYVTVALSSGQSTSPLTPAMLTATQVGIDSNGAPLFLSDYFQTWSSMTSGSATAAKTIGAAGTTATASFSGMIGVTSVPLRTGDATSVVGAQLGSGSCDAEDYR